MLWLPEPQKRHEWAPLPGKRDDGLLWFEDPMQDKTCRTCSYWAMSPIDNAEFGNCTMADEGKEIALHWVAVLPKNSKYHWEWKPGASNQIDFPDGKSALAVLFTDADFGCKSWQKRPRCD